MNNNVEIRSSRQVRIGTVVSFIAIIVNIISGLIFTPWLIHQLGDSDYGIYSIGTSIITLLLMDFGISEAVAKYVAQYRAEGDKKKIDELLSIVFKIYLLLSAVFLLLFVVLYFFLGGIYGNLTPEELVKLKNVFIIVAIYNVFAFSFTPLSGIMLAYEHLISLKFCDILTRLLTIGITVVCIYGGLGLYSAVLANAFAGIIVILYKLYVVQSNHHIKIKLSYKNKELLREVLTFSVWVALLMVTQRLIYNITPSILGALSNSRQVTLYSVSSSLEGYSYSFGSVIGTLFLARITRQLQEKDYEAFNDLVIRIGKMQLIVCLFIWIGFLCIGREFITLWMGESYDSTYFMTVILLIPNMIMWPFMTSSTALTVVNHVKESALVNLATAIINIALESILVRKGGAMGAVISIAIANSFKGLALVVVYKKYLPFRFWQFIRDVFLRYGIPMIAAAVPAYAAVHSFGSTSWGDLLLKIVIIVIILGFTDFIVIMIRDRKFGQILLGYLPKKK